MPYVIRNASNDVIALMVNPTTEYTEFLPDNNDEIQFFNLSHQKLREINSEVETRWDTLTVNSYTYSLKDPLYTNAGRAAIQALIGGATDVDLPDHHGVMHNLLIADASALMNILQNFINDILNNSHILENQVKSAADLTALQAIDTSLGWPSPPA